MAAGLLRVLVVGAGAVGGYFGGRLAQAGRDVTFLVHERRRAALERGALNISSPHGDATIKPKLVTAGELGDGTGVFDLVIVTTKAYSLESAMEDFAPAVGPKTKILPLLNGMAHLDALRARFGDDAVLGGSVRIIADLDADGGVHQATPLAEINYGALRTSDVEAAWLAWLDDTMRVPGVSAFLREDVVATMWTKWSIVGSMGIVCVLAGGSIGEAASAPHGIEQAGRVLDECLAVAAANGFPADGAVFEEHRKLLTDRSSTLTSSLYRDMTRGLPVEADHLLGDLIRRADDVPTPAPVPLMTAAYVRLKVYEAQQAQNARR